MKYRKIYEQHYGPIPIDEEGRTYDIHHIDGNRKNNDISNLKAISIQKHYNIHYSQGDWRACTKIAIKMKLSPEEISDLVSKQQKERVSNGTHHFLGGDIQRKNSRERVSNKTHHFCDSQVQTNINLLRVKNGTNPFANNEWQSIKARKLVENGTHHFVGNTNPVYKQLTEGTHPFSNRKQELKTCPVCNMTMIISNYYRWQHGDNCIKSTRPLTSKAAKL